MEFFKVPLLALSIIIGISLIVFLTVRNDEFEDLNEEINKEENKTIGKQKPK